MIATVIAMKYEEQRMYVIQGANRLIRSCTFKGLNPPGHRRTREHPPRMSEG